MKKTLLLVAAMAALAGAIFAELPSNQPDLQPTATCIGADNCKACKNCKYCGYCKKAGNTCGVCKPPPSKKK